MAKKETEPDAQRDEVASSHSVGSEPEDVNARGVIPPKLAGTAHDSRAF